MISLTLTITGSWDKALSGAPDPGAADSLPVQQRRVLLQLAAEILSLHPLEATETRGQQEIRRQMDSVSLTLTSKSVY